MSTEFVVSIANGPMTLEDLIALTPRSAPAVVAPDGSLNYGDLHDRADEIAKKLRAVGIATGSLVGLCLPRSTALVVGALAILRTGAAYVALDPAQPDRRLSALVADSGIGFVIGSTDISSRIPNATTVESLPAVGSLVRCVTDRAVDPEAGLAYVIYTSGSTGTPKGVMVDKGGVLNLARWHRTAFEVGPGDKCSQVGGPGFDAAAWEIWGTLLAGATLLVPPEQLKTDPAALRDWLVTEGVTVSFLPTPLAEAVLSLDWPAETKLRFLLTGGDRLHRAPRTGLPFAVVNNYGVTEASVVSTSGTVPAGVEGLPTIGHAIDGVQCRVIDAELNAVPDGEPGELVVGGVSVARGYLGRPDLTADRFITLPDSPVGVRWYRTGDIVRQRGDGEFEFASRLDEQVQIRGFRVEPGEIVVALDRHPAIAQSVVLSVGDTAPELVAYLQPTADQALTDDDLRAHLALWLPPQMTPTSFVWVDEMPMTSNGKVDRDVLTTLRTPSATTVTGRAPADELEELITEIVSGLLGVESIGVDENFLMLGGHSLLGAQLVTRLADEFGVEVSLRNLFDHPTPAGMAGLVRQGLIDQVSELDDETAARLTGTYAVAD
jgi:amino acid adenylation domain-containing protein